MSQVEAEWDLIPTLERQEHAIRERLEREEASLLRTGVPLVDYAVDQVRFFLEALRLLRADGLTQYDALERAELLSLPECLRRASAPWQRERLIKEARERQWLCWQRILDARHPDSMVGVLPRHPGWPVGTIQFSPYPSTIGAHDLTSVVTLEADVAFAFGLPRNPVHPFRELTPALGWSLQLVFSGFVRVLIDPPWDRNMPAARVALREMADHLEQLAESAAGAADPPPTQALKHWRNVAKALRGAANRLAHTTGRGRAAILQQCFSLPGLVWSASPFAFVTDDMPPDLMAERIGFALKATNVLSPDEWRRFKKFVELRLLIDHQAAGITTDEARQLRTKLMNFVRPLRVQSARQYEKKTLWGLRSPRAPGARVGGALRLIAERYRLHIRKVYRLFRAFLKERQLPRDREAVRKFNRILRRRSR